MLTNNDRYYCSALPEVSTAHSAEQWLLGVRLRLSEWLKLAAVPKFEITLAQSRQSSLKLEWPVATIEKVDCDLQIPPWLWARP